MSLSFVLRGSCSPNSLKRFNKLNIKLDINTLRFAIQRSRLFCLGITNKTINVLNYSMHLVFDGTDWSEV